MTTVEGREFVLHGRFAIVSRQVAAAAIERKGGRVSRGLTRRTSRLVVGAGAADQIGSGQLRVKLAKADRLRVRAISERELLGVVGLSQANTVAGGMSADEVRAKSELSTEAMRMLALFGVIGPLPAQHDIGDLKVCREVAGLLSEGAELAQVVAARVHLCDAQRGQARHDLVRRPDGTLALRTGETLTDLDGQIRLPLPEASTNSPDDIFEAAEAAEAAGDWELAETHYRQCADMDRADPISLFNLANVVRERGRPAEAVLHLQRAVGLDPRFAEAWYNLSSLYEERGERARAIDFLQRALKVDPDYGDALYNLARLHFVDGRYAEARRLWKRYSELDPDSEWGRNAARGVVACHQLQNSGSASKSNAG